MARPKKQTIEYFPHFVSSGKTLFILENEFGNDGYSFWFKLLEILGSTEGHVYDTGNPAELRFLIAKTRVSEETAIKILDMLAELDAIDDELWAGKIIWCQNLVDNVADVYSKRKCEMPLKPSLCYPKHEDNGINGEFTEQKHEVNGVSDNINPQSKVKESKVKESKVKEEESCGSSFNIFTYMQQRGFVSISPIMAEDVKSLIEMYSIEEVKQSLDISDNNGKHSLSYVKGILERRRAGEKEGNNGNRVCSTKPNIGQVKKFNVKIPEPTKLTEEERRRAETEII